MIGGVDADRCFLNRWEFLSGLKEEFGAVLPEEYCVVCDGFEGFVVLVFKIIGGEFKQGAMGGVYGVSLGVSEQYSVCAEVLYCFMDPLSGDAKQGAEFLGLEGECEGGYEGEL